jgi:predicted transcriptional regulator of viral defense system
MLNDPALGGGARPTVDVFRNYLDSDQKNTALLIEYADRLGNGAVFKRLGFIAERFAPKEETLIAACRKRLTKESGEGQVLFFAALKCRRQLQGTRVGPTQVIEPE